MKKIIVAGLASAAVLLLTGGVSVAGGAAVVRDTALKPVTNGPSASTGTGATLGSPLSSLQLFAVTDLQAALADAEASKDPIAAQCYSALIPLVQAATAPALPKSLGAFQLFQKSRDAIRLAQGSPDDALKLACGPLVLDAQTTALLLAARVGIAIPGGLLGKSALGIGATGASTVIGGVIHQLKALP